MILSAVGLAGALSLVLAAKEIQVPVAVQVGEGKCRGTQAIRVEEVIGIETAETVSPHQFTGSVPSEKEDLSVRC
jgi:hypothetical protein